MVQLQIMREKRRLTQKQLSELSGVTQQAISKIETGERKNPQITTLHKIAKVLNCTIDELIREPGKESVTK